jgi:acetylornithine deacetylase
VLEFEIRDIPGADIAGLLASIDTAIAGQRDDLKRQAAEADIVVEEISSYPPLMTPANGAAVVTVQRLAASRETAGTASFGTEAGIYARAGIPTVVCGPGDIGRAHKADEWIGLDELAAADSMMQRLADKLAKPAEEWITQ